MEASGSDTTERAALAGDEHTVWLDTSESPAVAGSDTPEREGTERDTTDDWRIEPGAVPATVAELEKRIDLAVATAQAAEKAALELSSATLEAAQQARRAAELAERASDAAARAAGEAASAAAAEPPAEPSAQPAVNRPATAGFLPRPESSDPREPDPFEERITAFRLRAERVMVRLQKLEVGADPGAGPSEIVRLRP